MAKAYLHGPARDMGAIARQTLPPARYNKHPVKEGDTLDILKEVLATYLANWRDTERLAPHFKAATLESTLRNVWQFVKTHVPYKVDPEGWQFPKAPARLWADKQGDCKSYSIFIASVLQNIGIPYQFKFVAWKPEQPLRHVYITVPDTKAPNGKYWILDAVLNQFNKEDPYAYSRIEMPDVKIARLDGLGRPTALTLNPVERIINADFNKLTDGELELMLMDAQLETDKARMAGIYGEGSDAEQGVTDLQVSIREALDAARNERAGVIGALDAWEAVFRADMYDSTRLARKAPGYAQMDGIGRVNNTCLMRDCQTKLRRQVMQNLCSCRQKGSTEQQAQSAQAKLLQNLPAELKPAAQIIKARFNDIPVVEVLQGMNDWDEEDEIDGVGKKNKQRRQERKKKRQEQRAARGGQTRAGAFLRKAAKTVKNTVKKVAKAVQRVVTTPLRGAMEAILRTPAAAGFLYTFLTDQQAAQVPQKVRNKRNRQVKFFNFLVKVSTMKPDHLKKLLRVGIQNTYRKTPEQILTEMIAKGRTRPRGRAIRGIYGVYSIEIISDTAPKVVERSNVRRRDPNRPWVRGIEGAQIGVLAAAALIGPIVELIKKIASIFKKRPDENAQDVAPDDGDWEGIDPGQAENLEDGVQNNPGQMPIGTDTFTPDGSGQGGDGFDSGNNSGGSNRTTDSGDGGGGSGMVIALVALGGLVLLSRN